MIPGFCKRFLGLIEKEVNTKLYFKTNTNTNFSHELDCIKKGIQISRNSKLTNLHSFNDVDHLICLARRLTNSNL